MASRSGPTEMMRTGQPVSFSMKADVLNTFKTIKVATAYEIGGKQKDYFPFENGEEVTPVYKEFPGWECDICGVRKYDDFPQQLKDYIAFIEKETGCPVRIISVGPDREAIVVR